MDAMDEAAVNAAGITPIQPMLDKIGTLKTPADIAQHLREEFAAGRGDAFNFYSNADFKDSQLVIAYADQGGLALPEKAYYLSDGSKAGDDSYKKIREAYVAHVSKQLQNAGIAAADADKQAKDVLAFETRLAKASLSPIEQRDPNNQYHFVKVADADKLSPDFPWSEFLKAQGVNVEGFSLSQPKFFAEFGKMVKDVPAEQWQAYFRAHLIDGMVNGRQTRDENAADLAGVELAWDALTTAQPALATSGKQTFFQSWARLWPQQLSTDVATRLAATNVHAPGQWRTNGPLVDQPSFGTAFECKAGTPMQRETAQQVVIWR